MPGHVRRRSSGRRPPRRRSDRRAWWAATVSAHPPWSIARSTRAAPGRMRAHQRARQEPRGARARDQDRADHEIGRQHLLLDVGPVRHHRGHVAAEDVVDVAQLRRDRRPGSRRGRRRRRRPDTRCVPAIPAPRMTTGAGRTPAAPERSTPRPPFCACRHQAPTWTARRPATSLIGASSGSEPSASWSVSYAERTDAARRGARGERRDWPRGAGR